MKNSKYCRLRNGALPVQLCRLAARSMKQISSDGFTSNQAIVNNLELEF